MNRILVMLWWVGLVCAGAGASIIEVDYDEDTQGLHTAGLFILWEDGFAAEFAVRFDQESLTGWELLQTVQSRTDLVVVAEDFGWGLFVDGLAYQGHSNQGYGGGEDWWHYWVRSGDDPWVTSSVGPVEQVVYDGQHNGWVYGRDTIPEPATLGLLAMGLVALRRRMAAMSRG